MNRLADRRSLPQVLESLSKRDLLQCLVWIQSRRNQLDTIQHLLQDRLTRQVAEPEPLLTVAEVAKRLSVPPGRVYELIHQGRLPKVVVGQKQVRIPASAVAALTTAPVRTKRDREAVL